MNLGGRLRRHLEDFSPESELSWTLGRRSLCYETKKTLGKVNGLYYLIFIHSFITLCHTTSISGIQFLSSIFRTPLQGQKTICIWILPRPSAVSWDINKVFLSTQAQSLFKSSLVSLVYFPYSHAIWQKGAFSPFCIFLPLDPPHFFCGRFFGFVLCICPRYFHLLFCKNTGRVFLILQIISALVFKSF